MDLSILGFILIGVGLCCAVGELFLPSGFFLVTSLGFIGVGVGLAFTGGSTSGVIALLGVLLGVPLLTALLFRVWPNTPLGRHLLLAKPRSDATLAAMPLHQEMEKLRGRIGKTLAPLRPAGVADFDGRRVDVITEGMMVDSGAWVRCIDVQAGKVVVRPVEKPKDLGDLDDAFFT
jgi:membrane-bound ClpP family serine protease